VIGIERVRAVEARLGEFVLLQPLLNQREVIEGVARLRIERGRRHQRSAGLAEAAQFEQDLPLEGSVDRNFA